MLCEGNNVKVLVCSHFHECMCTVTIYMNTHVYFIFVVPAEITNQVIDMLENETNPVTFSCQAFGQPGLTIIWHFDGVMINISNTQKYSVNISSSTNETGTSVISLLTIMNIQSSDVGTYTCFTENLIGSDQSSGILTVNGMLMYLLQTT